MSGLRFVKKKKKIDRAPAKLTCAQTRFRRSRSINVVRGGGGCLRAAWPRQSAHCYAISHDRPRRYGSFFFFLTTSMLAHFRNIFFRLRSHCRAFWERDAYRGESSGARILGPEAFVMECINLMGTRRFGFFVN